MNITIVFLAVIVLAGSFARAISGFGFALIATPLMALVMDARSVVVLIMLLGTIAGIVVLYHMRHYVDIRRALYLGLGSLPGIFLGTFLLVRMDPSIIKLWIAIVVAFFTVPLVMGHSHRFQHENIGCVVIGFISGLLAASTSLGGPPVVLYLLNQGMTKERFVGTISAYFLLIGVVTLGSYGASGVINGDILLKAAILTPVVYLGTYLGVRVLPKINARLFKKIAAGIVIVTALVIIITFFTG